MHLSLSLVVRTQSWMLPRVCRLCWTVIVSSAVFSLVLATIVALLGWRPRATVLLLVGAPTPLCLRRGSTWWALMLAWRVRQVRPWLRGLEIRRKSTGWWVLLLLSLWWWVFSWSVRVWGPRSTWILWGVPPLVGIEVRWGLSTMSIWHLAVEGSLIVSRWRGSGKRVGIIAWWWLPAESSRRLWAWGWVVRLASNRVRVWLSFAVENRRNRVSSLSPETCEEKSMREPIRKQCKSSHIPELVVATTRAASFASEVTVSLADTRASFVLLPNPSKFCQVLPILSRSPGPSCCVVS